MSDHLPEKSRFLFVRVRRAFFWPSLDFRSGQRVDAPQIAHSIPTSAASNLLSQKRRSEQCREHRRSRFNPPAHPQPLQSILNVARPMISTQSLGRRLFLVSRVLWLPVYWVTALFRRSFQATECNSTTFRPTNVNIVSFLKIHKHLNQCVPSIYHHSLRRPNRICFAGSLFWPVLPLSLYWSRRNEFSHIKEYLFYHLESI
jgi:hypothetical protein